MGVFLIEFIKPRKGVKIGFQKKKVKCSGLVCKLSQCGEVAERHDLKFNTELEPVKTKDKSKSRFNIINWWCSDISSSVLLIPYTVLRGQQFFTLTVSLFLGKKDHSFLCVKRVATEEPRSVPSPKKVRVGENCSALSKTCSSTVKPRKRRSTPANNLPLNNQAHTHLGCPWCEFTAPNLMLLRLHEKLVHDMKQPHVHGVERKHQDTREDNLNTGNSGERNL